MKVRIEIDDKYDEDEIVIRCSQLSSEIQNVYGAIEELSHKGKNIILYKKNTEYYISYEKVLFFETWEQGVRAHTVEEIYDTGLKLYELEEVLPGYFMRISKSTILNINQIYSITKNITASSIVELKNTHKQVLVSRNYLKPLKSRLEEKRMKG